jgi:hypothetical protein
MAGHSPLRRVPGWMRLPEWFLVIITVVASVSVAGLALWATLLASDASNHEAAALRNLNQRFQLEIGYQTSVLTDRFASRLPRCRAPIRTRQRPSPRKPTF